MFLVFLAALTLLSKHEESEYIFVTLRPDQVMVSHDITVIHECSSNQSFALSISVLKIYLNHILNVGYYYVTSVLLRLNLFETNLTFCYK